MNKTKEKLQEVPSIRHIGKMDESYKTEKARKRAEEICKNAKTRFDNIEIRVVGN